MIQVVAWRASVRIEAMNGPPEQASTTGCVVGIDFGTDSVRSIVVDAANGNVLGASVKHYPRWAKGLYCDPVHNQFRQHPLDYLESMEFSVRDALA